MTLIEGMHKNSLKNSTNVKSIYNFCWPFMYILKFNAPCLLFRKSLQTKQFSLTIKMELIDGPFLPFFPFLSPWTVSCWHQRLVHTAVERHWCHVYMYIHMYIRVCVCAPHASTCLVELSLSQCHSLWSIPSCSGLKACLFLIF